MHTRSELDVVSVIGGSNDCPCLNVSDDEAIALDWIGIHAQIWADKNMEGF